MTDSAPGRMRVLVALTGACRNPPLDACRELTADAAPELLGLFVEDRALLVHAESPLAREVVLSGLERRLDVAGLERQLRARAAGLRRAFEAEARRLGLAHAFDVVRGDPVEEFRRAVGRADALVADRSVAREALSVWSLEAGRPSAEGAALRTLLLVSEAPPGAEMFAIVSRPEHTTPTPGSLLDLALRMAERSGSPLTVLLTAEAAANAPRAHDAIRRLARTRGVALRLAPLGPRVEAAAVAAGGRRARLLLLGQPESLDTGLAHALLRRLRASLMLLRDS